MKRSARSDLRRLPTRGAYDAATIYKILDAGFLAHVGFGLQAQPFVIPTLYGRQDDSLYLHGSAASRMLRELENGLPACVTVTLVDAIVLARSAFHHSMNYRSVVAFGTARKIDDAERKLSALRTISEHLMKGRWEQVRGPNQQELKATTVLQFAIEEASAKIRTGPPLDDEEDYKLPVWAGIVPMELRRGIPVPDPRLAAQTVSPEYLNEEVSNDRPVVAD